MNTVWHCDTCNVDLKPKSKYSHLKSKTHVTKQTPPEPKECGICYETTLDVKTCSQCVNVCCATCHSKVDKCPFCRKAIRGAKPQRSVFWDPIADDDDDDYYNFAISNVWYHQQNFDRLWERAQVYLEEDEYEYAYGF